MKGEYYLGLDMEKHFGVYGYLTVHRLQKREEGFGQQNEDWIVVIGE